MKKISFATQTDLERLPKVASSNYKKKDFRTATKLVNELGEDPKLIKDTMQKMKRMGVMFVLNNHKTPVIYGHDKDKLSVHPMGINIFKQHLAKAKAESK